MNNENKELISQDELYLIIINYILTTLDTGLRDGSYWDSNSKLGHFYWRLVDGDGSTHIIGARRCSDHWAIYNDHRDDKGRNTNIKVFHDYIEFFEYSEFGDFDKEFMRGLYLKIKEVVEGV